MSTYFLIISCFYLPPILLLWLVFRPFLCRFDNIKIVLVQILTVFSLQWSYVVILRNTRDYQNDAIYTKAFGIPVEDYLKFGIQTAVTVLWATICSRCYHHWSKLHVSSPAMFYFIRCSVIGLLVWPIVWGFLNANGLSNGTTYFLGMIFWTMMPIVAFIWYLAGNYIMHAFTTMAISVLIPTLYFCYIDHIAIYYRIWDFQPNVVLKICVNNLPIDQILYYIAFNTIIVFILAAFDKAKAVLNTFHPREQLEFSYNLSFRNDSLKNSQRLLKGLWANESFLPSEVIEDLKACVNACTQKLGKYSVLMCLFHSDVLQDASIVLGFFSVIHGILKAAPTRPKDLKRDRLGEIKKFLDELFQGRSSIKRYSWVDKEGNRMDSVGTVNWSFFEKCLTKEQLAVFRAFSRIAYYLPHEPIYDFLKYHDWDLKKKPIKNENDYIEFGGYMYGSIIDTVLFVYCHKTNQWLDNYGAATEYLFERVKKVGMCYFLIRTSVNIFADSLIKGRTHIPINYFEQDEHKWLTEEQNPFEVDDDVLKKCTDKLIIIYKKLVNEAINVLDFLPDDLQAIAVTLICAFQYVAKAISENTVYEVHLNISRTKLISIILTGIYFGNINWLRAKPKPEKEYW